MRTPRATDAIELSRKVDFLSRPESYPEPTRRVELVETHMSWVFLTDRFAYKLKKPVRLPFLDFSTLARRRHFCREEVRLNQRLAPLVYIDALRLVESPDGGLAIGGAGRPVEWLVKMHRLPARTMLDHAIRRGSVRNEDLDRLAERLTAFYGSAEAVDIGAREYRRRFEADVAANLREFRRSQDIVEWAKVEQLHRRQLAFLDSVPWLLEQRATTRKIIEAHGDLRPEHVSLGPEPQIIDCLEFQRRFRIMDPADELAFFAVECEMLGAPEIGALVERQCRAGLRDDPAPTLLRFYRCYRACVKAKLAIWHLTDPQVRDPARWPALARRYLDLAETYARDLPRP